MTRASMFLVNQQLPKIYVFLNFVCRFIDVSCKFPGSCHDSAVFKGSSLSKVIDEIIPKVNLSFLCINTIYAITLG